MKALQNTHRTISSVGNWTRGKGLASLGAAVQITGVAESLAAVLLLAKYNEEVLMNSIIKI